MQHVLMWWSQLLSIAVPKAQESQYPMVRNTVWYSVQALRIYISHAEQEIAMGLMSGLTVSGGRLDSPLACLQPKP